MSKIARASWILESVRSGYSRHIHKDRRACKKACARHERHHGQATLRQTLGDAFREALAVVRVADQAVDLTLRLAPAPEVVTYHVRLRVPVTVKIPGHKARRYLVEVEA